MSLFYGYQKADIDLKNVPVAVNGGDAISKQALENYLTKYREKSRYETVFDININRAVANGGIVYHPGDVLVKLIKDGKYYLHQDDILEAPEIKIRIKRGDSCIHTSSSRVSFMNFTCPELIRPNVSVFIVLKRRRAAIGRLWEYIVGNDNGGYDKFIGYGRGSLTKLFYGGGFPVKERSCTIPNGSDGNPIDTAQVHLISCHWLMSGSHVRVNNIISTDSYFDSYWKHTGEPFSSILANNRLISTKNPLAASLCALKIVSGFLEPSDIDTISQEMMAEYNILVNVK